ncbi:MAG TPA: DUF2934 domain-containing protein [Candidatus Eisenbacteria bacterium]|jgi:hypothetical protein|nr:DUF2934 domain-containing protein [Candidatus Eisenbacteria bacterium]
MAKIATSSAKKDSGASRKNGTQQEIEKLAYQFFVERGCEHGHDREDWLRAEGIVRGRSSS